jgi:hypothetical protein
MRIIFAGIYLGIGAMLHAMFRGATFDWSSAWTFGWLFGWPVMLFVSFGGVLLALLVALGIGWVAWLWLDMFAKWRHRRRTAR